MSNGDVPFVAGDVHYLVEQAKAKWTPGHVLPARPWSVQRWYTGREILYFNR